MKQKLSLLLLALISTLGAWATVTQPTLTTDETNPTYYVIQNFRSGKYANYVGTSAQLTQVTSASATVNALWYFVQNGNGVSIVPAADPTVKLASTESATADGAVWYTPENPYNAGTFCVSLTSGATANCWDDQGGHTTIGYWQPAANDFQGTSWNLVEVSVTKEQVDAGTVDMTFALTKLDVLARLAPLSSLSVYTEANVAAVRNAADETALNEALKAFEANISLYCRSGKYLVAGASACEYVTTPSEYNHVIQLESAGNGCFYLKGYKSEKYIGQVRQSAAVSTTSTADESFYFENSNGYIVVKNVSGGGYAYIHNGGGGCVGWEPSAANTQHTIAEVNLPAAMVNVTYHLMVGGVDKAQSTVECGVGDAPDASALFVYPYTTFTYDVETIAANTTDVYATAVFNMPFVASTDYDNAKWYYMQGHATYSDRYISTNGTATVWGQGKSNTDAYKWAFIGNPVEGIKVINKASGAGYYLTDTDPATMSTTAKAWIIKKQTNTSYAGGNGFGLWDASRTYLNTQGSTLKYWSNFDQGSTFWVEEVPDIVVNVTFNLLVGEEIVNTVVQEDVAGNTTISVPTDLTANYSALGYDFTGNGDVNVGETDLTVNVTATLKDGVVADLANLSNTKAYTLSTARGALYIKNDHLASNSNANAGATAGKFAILSHEDNYYLYSVDASKFVLGDGSLSETPTAAIETLGLTAQAIKPLFFGKLGSNGLNVTNTNDDYELAINTWVTADLGNRYCIAEVEDFDATAALAALEEHFSGPTQFAEAIAALQAIDFGTGLGQYSLTGEAAGYTSQANAIVDQLEESGYTEEGLAMAQGFLANYALNMPTGKFIRLYSEARGVYWGTAASGKHPNVTDVANAGIYYVAADGKVLSMDQAAYLQNAAGAPCTTADGAGTFEFAEAGNGKYYVKSGGYMVAWTSATDRLQSPDQYAVWTITEVADYDYTLTVGETGYATLCFPVALTIPGGVKAHTGYIDEDGYFELTEITETIPAETPVVLKAEAGAYTFAPTTAEAFTGTNELSGTLGKKTVATGDYVLAQPTVNEKVQPVGFYKASGSGNIAGFKAYLNKASEVKGFTFKLDDNATAINEVNGQWSMVNGQSIFNLAGQRIQKMQNQRSTYVKGINIVNGKKVLR